MTTLPSVPLFGVTRLFGFSKRAWLWLALPLAANVGLAVSVLAEAAPGLAEPPAPRSVPRLHVARQTDGDDSADEPTDAYAALTDYLPPLTKAVAPAATVPAPGAAPQVDLAALFAGRPDPRTVAAALDAVTTEELGSAPQEIVRGSTHEVIARGCGLSAMFRDEEPLEVRAAAPVNEGLDEVIQ